MRKMLFSRFIRIPDMVGNGLDNTIPPIRLYEVEISYYLSEYMTPRRSKSSSRAARELTTTILRPKVWKEIMPLSPIGIFITSKS